MLKCLQYTNKQELIKWRLNDFNQPHNYRSIEHNSSLTVDLKFNWYHRIACRLIPVYALRYVKIVLLLLEKCIEKVLNVLYIYVYKNVYFSSKDKKGLYNIQ